MEHPSRRRLLVSTAASGLLAATAAGAETNYLGGTGRMTVFAGGGKAYTQDFAAGDVIYVEQSNWHCIQNTGTDVLSLLEIFASDRYAEVTLAEWIANTPRELVAARLNVDPASLASLRKPPGPVVPA